MGLAYGGRLQGHAGGSTAPPPPRIRGRVVEGRAMGWDSGVGSRTTKSVGGGTAAGSSTARRGTAHFPSSTGALVVWEFGWAG